MSSDQDIDSSCRDGCGRLLTLGAEGWTFLQVQNRWRCPACQHALEAANGPALSGAQALEEAP